MRDLLHRRLAFLQAIEKRPWVRFALGIWALSGAWDIALQQWIPEEYAKHLPKVYQVIAMATGLTSWQIWFCIGVLIIALASFEYAFRKTHPPSLARGPQQNASPHPTAESIGYLTANEVLHYMADETEWGNLVGRHAVVDGIMTIRKIVPLEAIVEFRRIAQEGNIKAIGRLNGSGTHVDIPVTHWMSAALSYEAVDRSTVSRTEPAVPNPKGVPTYDDVKISRKDVERAWPRKRDNSATTPNAHA